ncbi:MAG: TetR/AcrR family transcriptional regulator [Leptospiraceae bacterium]|nr:TetR/AcrR family transcriptional regulator [Leptospiraceae bacterium]
MPRIVDHQAFREELLERSFPLFARRGYAQLSMRQIATELNVSTGTLYHYFPAKEAIFEQMFASMSRRMADRVMEFMRQADSDHSRLEQLFAFTALEEQNLQDLLLLILDYQRHAGSESTLQFRREIALFFREVIGDKLGRDHSARAGLVLSILMGILAHRFIDDSIDFASQADMARDMLLARSEPVAV